MYCQIPAHALVVLLGNHMRKVISKRIIRAKAQCLLVKIQKNSIWFADGLDFISIFRGCGGRSHDPYYYNTKCA